MAGKRARRPADGLSGRDRGTSHGRRERHHRLPRRPLLGSAWLHRGDARRPPAPRRSCYRDSGWLTALDRGRPRRRPRTGPNRRAPGTPRARRPWRLHERASPASARAIIRLDLLHGPRLRRSCEATMAARSSSISRVNSRTTSPQLVADSRYASCFLCRLRGRADHHEQAVLLVFEPRADIQALRRLCGATGRQPVRDDHRARSVHDESRKGQQRQIAGSSAGAGTERYSNPVSVTTTSSSTTK